MEHRIRALTGPLLPVASRALVTGGSSGIGRDLAWMLADASVTVYILGRRRERLDEAASRETPGRIVPVVADIRDADAVANAFDIAEADGDRCPCSSTRRAEPSSPPRRTSARMGSEPWSARA